MNFKAVFACILAFGASHCLWGQTLNGNASSPSPGCYQLTPNVAWQVGSVWFPDTLNLDQAWTISCSMNFGTQDATGADGIAFVLQNNDAFQLGGNGEGLGYLGVANSLNIEFDTFQNTNLNDPSVDHIAIMRDGVNIHGTANNLAGPVQAPPVGANIEDGLDHIVDIRWDPSSTRIEVYFDCSLRLTLVLDIKNAIFGGDNMVRWGFSAGSGGSFNPHSVCLLSPPVPPIPSQYVLCPGDSVQLQAPASANNTWTWTPNWQISDTSSQSPTVFPTTDTVYHVAYQNRCGQAASDSFSVHIFQPGALDLGPDTIVCANPPLVLDASVPFAQYLWSTGDSTPTLSVLASGTYSVTASIAGCAVSDTISILFNPVSVDLGPDGPLCSGDTISLSADPNGLFPSASFVWSTGATTANISLFAPGTYAVTLTENGCTDRDTLILTAGQYPAQSLPSDTLNCSGAPITLVGTPNAAQYAWSTGESTPQIQVILPGLYTVTLNSADGCATIDSILVVGSAPPLVDLGQDTVYCGNTQGRRLDAYFPGATYLWSTGQTDSMITVSQTDIYSVTVTNACGTAQDAVNLTFFEYPEGYFIPNVFTPNGDGINDVFRVQSARPEEYRLFIYDRWGNLRFETRNHETGWEALQEPEGIYYFAIHTTDCQGYLVKQVGWVTLLR